jgi:uncharacterized membrane protein
MKRACLVGLLLLGAGCPKPKPPSDAPATASGPGAAEAMGRTLHAAGAPAAGAQDASGLPLVRGIVVLSAEAPRLTPCGQATPVTLRDETGGRLAEAYGQLASEQTGEMWAELRAATDANGITAREVVRASPVGEGDPCASLPAAGEIRAFGNEPFWAITVTATGIELREPDAPDPLVFPLPAPTDNGTSRTWTTELPGPPARRLQLVVGPARCKDGMSGAWYALAAEAVVDGRALAGCATRGE